ncbi:MAG: T9SS type A sorting domain-containing protein [Saprospiraceae bacterium]|nr:T9SS type A sorting domain-containing protein [Saprospiraceae bacterium]
MICFFVIKFQTFLSAQNLIENPSFEDFNNCTNYNQFQCGCYPNAFYEACLEGAWHNATGTSALSDHWLNNGPIAQSGSYYGQTQQRITKNQNGTTYCNLFETFYYDFSETGINKLYAGQAYQLRLWYYGYNINLQLTDFTYNVKVDAITGFTNQESPTPSCDDQIPTSVQNVLSSTNINGFSQWKFLDNTFTIQSDKTQLWFRPEVNESSVAMNQERKINVLFDNVSLTCNSLISTTIQQVQNGNSFTFTLVKTGGPSDANIGEVKWLFEDGSTEMGNPVMKTITQSGPFYITASFVDSRGCTGSIKQLITPTTCGCTGTPIFINSNQIWSTPVVTNSQIIILPGSRLKINNTSLNMAPGCKISVAKGARLDIVGSTLDVNNTAQCAPGRWGGIEVWGAGDGVSHPSPSQIYNGSYPTINDHGVVYSYGNTVIKNASQAIKTQLTNAPYFGGIVIAFDTKFLQNTEGVTIGPFRNPNIGRFIDCEFKGDGTPQQIGTSSYKYGLKLISNNEVFIAKDDNGNASFSNMVKGIIAQNAGYWLSGYTFNSLAIGCENTSDLNFINNIRIGSIIKPGEPVGGNPNIFTNCIFGIKNNGINVSNISDNDFTNVKYGIDQRGVGMATIELNKFSTVTNSVYLQNTSNFSPSIYTHCNTYNSSSIGINAFQNNISATFEEELFNLPNPISRDVVVWGTSNVTGTMTPVMGSPASGVVNIFSTSSRDFAVATSNTEHHTYYAQKPDNNSYGTRWVPRCPDNPDPLYDEECTIAYNYERHTKLDGKAVQCLGAPIVEVPTQYPCRNFSCLTQLVADYNSFLTLHTNYLSLGEYWNLLKQKESAYNTLFVRYTEQRMQDSMLLLLNLENNETNHERRIQFTVNESQFGTARSQVGTLPTNTRDEIDRVVLWYIIIDQSEQDTAFVLMPDYRAFVEELAYNNRLYTPRAQAILTSLDGRIFEPVQPDLSGGSVRLGQINKKEIKIYPNPSVGYINIELKALNLTKPASFKVFNTIGEIKAIGTLNEEIKTLDFTNMHPGAYTIQVTTMDAEVLYAKFIIIK